MTHPHPPLAVLRAAREWAEQHGHQQPDDRMLAIVYAAGRESVARDIEDAYDLAKSYHYRSALRKAVRIARGLVAPRRQESQ